MTMSRFFILASVLFVTACNTVQGVGEDLSEGGQAVQEAAVENQ